MSRKNNSTEKSGYLVHPVAPVEFFLSIRSERIGWLRFILEGYDGLALLTTLSTEKGLVRIRTLQTGFVETMQLIETLAPDLTRINLNHNDNSII